MRATIFQAELIPENGPLVTSNLVSLGGFAKEGVRLEPKGYLRLNQLEGQWIKVFVLNHWKHLPSPKTQNSPCT